MDAEMIRDQALASCCLLVRTVGGPSVKPYQPEGVWDKGVGMTKDSPTYQQDVGPNLYRRSLYTFWKRTAPPPSMDAFDAPNREACTGCRERTNTPLQALVGFNDVQLIEAARHLAELALKKHDSDSGRIDFIAKRVLARSLDSAEQRMVQSELQELTSYYRHRPADAAHLISLGDSKADSALDPRTLAAWTMTVNQLLNLDEALCK
jgi:hypothetical protein